MTADRAGESVVFSVDSNKELHLQSADLDVSSFTTSHFHYTHVNMTNNVPAENWLRTQRQQCVFPERKVLPLQLFLFPLISVWNPGRTETGDEVETLGEGGVVSL